MSRSLRIAVLYNSDFDAEACATDVMSVEASARAVTGALAEILADQHYLTIRRLLDASRIRVASLTGSLTAAKPDSRPRPGARCACRALAPHWRYA